MAVGRPKKEFQEYLLDTESTHISQDEYMQSPATAFLRYCVDAKDAVNYCLEYFKKNKKKDFTKDGRKSLKHILSAMLPAIMGHFETYQRYLFSGVFEMSPLIRDFDIIKFFKKLEKETSILIDPVKLSAYRGFKPHVGILLADNLHSWHDPEKVNAYFRAFDLKVQFYSKKECQELKVLWQLRHSIVHTGGTITLADAQKTPELVSFGEEVIVFEDNFILEVARKLHPLVRDATRRLEKAFRGKLNQNVPDTKREIIDKLFLVKSVTSVWLR